MLPGVLAPTLADRFGLAGRLAVVTGGTSGLGAANALALARAGAAVVVVGRDEERGEAVVETILRAGGDARFAACEVADRDAVEELAGWCEREMGPVDVLVTAAGMFRRAAALALTEEDWRLLWQVNVDGTLDCCRAFGAAMLERGRGSVVTYASTDAYIGIPEWLAYCMTKGAVLQATAAIGAAWAPRGVRVNGIAPSDFLTPMLNRPPDDPAYARWIRRMIPAGRLGMPDEVSAALLLLVGPAGAGIAGHTILVDGGRVAV